MSPCTLIAEIIKKLEALFTEFHQRAKELKFPKTYRWKPLFENFSKTFSELPGQSNEQETAYKGQLFRFKNAEVLVEIQLKRSFTMSDQR